jgi:tRNA(Ile)-lysidine synthase TilS/MesJ
MSDKITGYCVKCKEKGRDMVEVQRVEIKKGTPAAKGKCSVCGTGMYRILPKNS